MTGLPSPDPGAQLGRKGLMIALVPLVMVAAAFAAVPAYEAFCKVTGFGGTTQLAQARASGVLERQIDVRFVSNVAAGLPFEFKPLQTRHRIHIGEEGLAFYKVTNLSNVPVTAVATYNVAPHSAGIYFMKLQCFCFAERTFAPGETAELPVLFFVDPALAENADMNRVASITLSYTFFEAKDAAVQRQLEARKAAQAALPERVRSIPTQPS